MKKSLLALSLTALLFSCKKETTPEAFTPTDLTGTAHVKGNTSKNVITPNGAGLWINTARVPAAGVNVTVRVLKGGVNGVYPNSTAQGADVYSAQTDVNGNYDIPVKANGTGVSATVTIDGFTATLDTVINGVKKPGLWANYIGGNGARTVWSGQTSWFDFAFTAANLSTNPNNVTVGSAQVTGSVSMSLVKKAVTTGTAATTMTISNMNVAVPAGTKVYLDFTIDPLNLATKSYIATTDAAGVYSFNLATVNAGTAGFAQNAVIWVADFSAKRDTLTYLNGAPTGTTNGLPGVYGNQSVNQAGVYNNEIRNAINLNYSAGSFIPN